MKKFVNWIALCTSFVNIACEHTQNITQEHLLNDNNEDITVCLKNGRILNFKGGKYVIVMQGYSGVLKGEREETVNGVMGESKTLKESVDLDEIQTITKTETTTFGKIATMTIIGGLAFVVTLYFALKNWHM